MPHHAREIVERELSQMDWSAGRSRAGLLEHFRMAPTIRQLLVSHLPDKTFRSAAAVLEAIPQSGWDVVEQTMRGGTPESHFLQSLAAKVRASEEPTGLSHSHEQAAPPK